MTERQARAASSGKAGAWARRALDGDGPFLFASLSWDLDDIFGGFETK